MGQDHEYVVKGKQAKEILDELQRAPTQKKLDRLRKALRNRIGQKRKGSPE